MCDEICSYQNVPLPLQTRTTVAWTTETVSRSVVTSEAERYVNPALRPRLQILFELIDFSYQVISQQAFVHKSILQCQCLIWGRKMWTRQNLLSYPFESLIWVIFTACKRSCGKVMFLHLSVSHSVHRGRRSLYDVTSCLATWSHVPSGTIPVSGPMFLLGVSVSGPMFLPGTETPGQRSPGQRPP